MKEQELYRDLIFPFVKGNELKEMIVSFIKKDGTARVMKCKYGVRKEDSKGMNYDAEAKGLISVFDIEKQEYRVIPVATIRYLSVGRQHYKIVDKWRGERKLKRRNGNV